MANDLLHALIRANLSGTAVALVLIAVRAPLRKLIGPNAVYALWLSVLAAGLASLLPSRIVTTIVHAVPSPSAAMVAPAHGLVGMDWPALLISAWAAVALAAGVAIIWRHYRFLAQLNRIEEVDGVVKAASPDAGPAVIGLISPRILIPGDFEARFSPRERSVILAHERVHLARGDSRINALVLAVQCLCWFNPVAYAAARALRLDQELACDATVMAKFPATRRSYAEAMLKSQTAPVSLPGGCYWQAKGASALSRRLALLKVAPLTRGQMMTGLSIALLMTSGAGVAGWVVQPARQRIIIQPVPQTPAAALSGVATAPQSLPAVTPSQPAAMAVQRRAVEENDRTDTTWLPLPRPASAPSTLFHWNSMPMPPEPEGLNIADAGAQASSGSSEGPVLVRANGGSQTYRQGDYRMKSDFTLVGDKVEVKAELYKSNDLIASGAGTATPGNLAWIALSNGQIAQVAPGKTAYIITPPNMLPGRDTSAPS